MTAVSMSSAVRLRVYRASLFSTVRSLVGCAVILILGLVMVTNGGEISVAVLGALVLVFSFWLIADVATDRLIVTPDGLVYINHLRQKFVSWAEISSFAVGYGRSRRWSTLIIRRTDGSYLVTDFNSLTRTYPAHIADELTGWQRKLAPPPKAKS
jgi:hypothetical protein